MIDQRLRVFTLAEDTLIHWGHNRTRCNGVDPNIVGGVIHRRLADQGIDAAFSRSIGRPALNIIATEVRPGSMKATEIHQCQCERCQHGNAPNQKLIHHQINVVMSRLDEQQRRWYATVEANRYGYGGQQLVSQITGLDEKTIQRGQQELELDLEKRPQERIRLAGAGQPSTKKKSQA